MKYCIVVFFVVITLNISACTGNNVELPGEIFTETNDFVKLFQDEKVYPFSYDEYIQGAGRNHYKGDPKLFKNTSEKIVKTKEEIIDLAKNELTVDYDAIMVFYDESCSILMLLFYMDGWTDSGQTVCMDEYGVTCYIGYGAIQPFEDIFDVMPLSYEEDLDYVLRIPDTKIRDKELYKNTTATEIVTKEKAIEQAKNELIIPYDVIIVRYDETQSIWMVDFLGYSKWNRQCVFMDENGITLLIADRIMHEDFDNETNAH